MQAMIIKPNKRDRFTSQAFRFTIKVPKTGVSGTAELKKRGCRHGQPLFLPLGSGDRFRRTDPGAGAAVLTLVRIYPADVVLFGNCFHRAFTVASAAIYALVINLIRHI
jgi:hypothetical protein